MDGPELTAQARSRARGEEGLAVLIAVISLSLFSLLGVYMALNASTELRISDNYETRVAALNAARAGLSHTRDLLKGLNYNDILKGPDGTYDSGTTYMTNARKYSARNPITPAQARALDISDPSSTLSGTADDGILCTGKNGTTNGTALIPLTGLALTAPNPYGSGTITTGRYFVKVSDNTPDAGELAADITNNPFIDGDGEILVRSMGVAQTIREGSASTTVRANLVAVLEARFRRANQFDLDSPFLVQGPAVQPASPNMFSGNAFDIDGGSSNYGISTIDTNLSDGVTPFFDIYSSLTTGQRNNIDGLGGSPSMTDITAAVTTDVDKSKLLDPAYLYDFATNVVPGFADHVYAGPLKLTSANTPSTYDIGYYDYTKPYTHPSQRPQVTIIQGDLELSGGGVEGGGLLVVTGKLFGSGSLTYNGLILVIGEGSTDLYGVNADIHGGIYTVNVKPNATTGVPEFGIPKISMGGNSNVIFDANAIDMGVGLMPPTQKGVREITSEMDPT